MDLNEVALIHNAYVEKMGWHSKTPLENLALIVSKIGECMDLCFDDTTNGAYAQKLTNIVLRLLDFSQQHGIKFDTNEEINKYPWRSACPSEDLGELLVTVSKIIRLMNANYFEQSVATALLTEAVLRTNNIAEITGVNIERIIDDRLVHYASLP